MTILFHSPSTSTFSNTFNQRLTLCDYGYLERMSQFPDNQVLLNAPREPEASYDFVLGFFRFVSYFIRTSSHFSNTSVIGTVVVILGLLHLLEYIGQSDVKNYYRNLYHPLRDPSSRVVRQFYYTEVWYKEWHRGDRLWGHLDICTWYSTIPVEYEVWKACGSVVSVLISHPFIGSGKFCMVLDVYKEVYWLQLSARRTFIKSSET